MDNDVFLSAYRRLANFAPGWVRMDSDIPGYYWIEKSDGHATVSVYHDGTTVRVGRQVRSFRLSNAMRDMRFNFAD